MNMYKRKSAKLDPLDCQLQRAKTLYARHLNKITRLQTLTSKIEPRLLTDMKVIKHINKLKQQATPEFRHISHKNYSRSGCWK